MAALATLALQAGVATAPAGELAAGAESPEYFIVVTGGELLEGTLADSHTHFLTRTLRPLGLRCAGSLIVDDHRAEMLAALRFATNRAPLVLVTGGLGPTPNDITRETLSEFTGIPLRESEAAVAELERRFRQSRDQLRANLRRQCLVPERGRFLPNPRGTAVGLIFDLGPGRAVVALPGPPRELQPMVRDELVPWLQRHFRARRPGASLTLRFVGVGQSQIDQTLKDKVPLPPDVIVTSLFEGSRVDFTFHLPGNGAADSARLRELERAVRRELGEYLYAADGRSLEAVVLGELQSRGARLAVAEVASGGSLAAALNGTAEADAVITGAFTAPTDSRLAELIRADAWQADASAEARVKTLAEAAAARGHADWAVAVGEKVRDTAEAAVWVAVKAGERVETHRLAWRDRSDTDRAALVTQILDLMRRRLNQP